MTQLTDDDLRALIERRDPLEAARAAAAGPGPVHLRRGPAPDGWLCDPEDAEGAIEEHGAAHRAGRPSEATLLYGHGHSAEGVAARLSALASLARQTGLLRTVCPCPADGTADRPGSWGVEDLTVIAACRAALPPTVHVAPSWRLLGAAACQVAVAFGATAWHLPVDDLADPAHLAQAIGRQLTEAPTA